MWLTKTHKSKDESKADYVMRKFKVSYSHYTAFRALNYTELDLIVTLCLNITKRVSTITSFNLINTKTTLLDAPPSLSRHYLPLRCK